MSTASGVAPSMHSARQNLSMETLRGLACVLLVAYHVVGSVALTNGLKLPSEHTLHRLNEALSHVRMPLFTFISGYVYCYRPLSDALGRFLRGKLRRLGLPLVVVASLFALLQHLTPGTSASQAPDAFWRIYLFPFAHYWYLQALLVIFALFALLEYSGLTRRPRALAGLLLGLCLFYPYRGWLPGVFSLQLAFYLFPYFILGVLFHRVLEPVVRTHARLSLPALALLCLGYPLLTPVLGDTGTLSHLSLGFSLLLLLLVASLPLRVPPLARLGAHSYAIYLLHVFFTAGMRLVLERLGLGHDYLGFLLGLAAGLLGPILVYRACAPLPWARVLLFGQSPPRPRPLKPALPTAGGFPPSAD